jgi:outer membrane murein-binding lipoprotein Lpp
VSELRAKVDAMEQALDGVKARGTKETEIEDVRARVKKLGDDVDKLRSASADDWWDVTKTRVSEYVDRVEQSVKRLDDNKG